MGYVTLLRSFTNDELYNCQPGNVEPDWSDFVSLEIAACRSNDGETTSGLKFADLDVQFFAVYGRTKSGDVEPITDILNDADALPLAGYLSLRSRLPLTLYRVF